MMILLVGVRLFGVQVYTVLSGSMEPKIHTGSVIYVVDADPADLEAGDVITYKLGGTQTIATHRIVEVIDNNGDLQFRTKGDANEHEDNSPVAAAHIIGTPVFTIPLLGYIATFIQQPPGSYLAIAIGAVILALVMLPDLLDPKKKPQDGSPENP